MGKFHTRPETDLIVIHCSASPWGRDDRAADIERWHLERGWSGIGYHGVITIDGTYEPGRPIDAVGAHALGHNLRSVGICLIGGKTTPENKAHAFFTDAQWSTLHTTLSLLQSFYPNAKVVGHNELTKHKACPTFDVQRWMSWVGLSS